MVFEGGGTSVVDGPFTESKEVIAGYWIWEVSSLEEAVEWARRCPYDPQYGDTQILEIRPFFEMGDFDAVSEETLARERELHERAAAAAGDSDC